MLVIAYWIVGGLTVALIVCLLIPKTRKIIFAWLDGADSRNEGTKPQPKVRIPKAARPASVPRTTSNATVEVLVEKLNAQKPTEKSDIHTIVIATLGEKVPHSIVTDPDDLYQRQKLWLIQINFQSANVKVAESEPGTWRVKPKAN